MSLWSAIQTAWKVGRSTDKAVHAALDAMDNGPLAALHAFAAATEGQLDDTAVQALDQALRKLLVGLQYTTTAAAWLAQHESTIRQTTTQVLDAVTDIGYRAGAWKHTITHWLEKP